MNRILLCLAACAAFVTASGLRPAHASEVPALAAEIAAEAPLPTEAEVFETDPIVESAMFPALDDPRIAADDRLVTLTLDDVPLEDVVRMFMRIPGANFITSPTNLVGSVSVNLTDVPWKPALVSILATRNLVLVEKTPDSGIYSIEPRRPDAPEPLEVRTLFLKYAEVKDVETALQPVLIPEARLSLFPSRNALIVKTTVPNMREVQNVIGEIDRMREQVFIEAKFMELNDEAIQNLGINWEGLRGVHLTAGGIQWAYEKDRERERISDRVDMLSDRFTADRTYATHDRTHSDVRVNRRFDAAGNPLEISSSSWVYNPVTDGYDLVEVITPTTLDDSGRSRGLSREYSTAESHLRGMDHEIQDFYRRSAQDVRTAVLGMADFNVILSALRETEGVSVVSNPKIVVANEEKATIHIGQTERPFISTVTPATESSAPFTTYNPGDPVEFGVKLDVTPTINTSSNISLLIEPMLTRFVRDAVAPTGQTYPIIARKRISTRFTLEDGKTVAIGGLTETGDVERVKKVPLLGDIPLIGRYLFTHTRNERRQTETIIFVTVGMASPHHIRRDQGLPAGTRLTQRHVLRQQLERHEREQELEALRQVVEQTLAPSVEPEAEDRPGVEPGVVPAAGGAVDPAAADHIRRAFGR